MAHIRGNLSFAIANSSYHYVHWGKDVIEGLTSYYENNSSNYKEDITSNSTSEVRRDPLYIVIPVTIIYASIFFTGTIGNISTCFVIARNKSMHTATNYYLFSLAVSDLLLLVSGLPAEIYMVWYKYPYIFGEGFCVLRGLAAETSTNASVLIITAFTIERYLAICHPFLSQTMSNLSRAVKLILILWLVAFSFALPQALQFGVVQHELNPNIVMCTMKRILVRHSFELSTFLFFVVPMCLITVLYALIGLKLRKSNLMKRNSSGMDTAKHCRHQTERSSRRVLRMLVAVVIAFFICWAPFHVQRLVAIYGTNTEDHITSNSKWIEFIYLLLTYVSGVLYYVSTTINPILYNIMSNKFRVAFMETLWKGCRIPAMRNRNERPSYSSLSRSQQLRMTHDDYSLQDLGTLDAVVTAKAFNTRSIVRQNSEDSVTARLMRNSPLASSGRERRDTTLTTAGAESLEIVNLQSNEHQDLKTDVNATVKTSVTASLKVNVNVDVRVNVNRSVQDWTEKKEDAEGKKGVGKSESPSLVPCRTPATFALQRNNETLGVKKCNLNNCLTRPRTPDEHRNDGYQVTKWLPRLKTF